MLTNKTNLQGVLKHRVVPSDLATNWQNDVPVLATPILLWLAELACMRAIDGTVDDGKMTLGLAHDVQHMAPTPADWMIQIRAEVIERTDKVIKFAVEAFDDEDQILSGTHTRAIVVRDKFVSKVYAKSAGQAESLSQKVH